MTDLVPQEAPEAPGMPAAVHNAVVDGVTALLGLTWDHRSKPKAEDRTAVYPGWLVAVAHHYVACGLEPGPFTADLHRAFGELCGLSSKDTPWPGPLDLLRRAIPGPVLLRMSREEAEEEQAVAKLPEAQVAAEQARLAALRREQEAAAAAGARIEAAAREAANLQPASDGAARARDIRLMLEVKTGLTAAGVRLALPQSRGQRKGR